MSTLELDILATESVLNQVQPARCTFTRSGDTPTSANTALKFTQTERVYDGPLSKVYRGTLTDGHGMCEQVICKLVQLTYAGGDPATLKHAADIYTKYLTQAQGICVPKFYGLFEGIILEDIAACVILEDCGEPLTQEQVDDDIRVRYVPYFSPYAIHAHRRTGSGKVYRALMTIHKLGVVHRDFMIGNILVDNLEKPTRVNIIDFEFTEPHKCGFGMKLYAFTMNTDFRGCKELRDVAKGLQLITP